MENKPAKTAVIVFDPPLDEPLSYRWEKTVEQDGKTRMSWSVDEYRFEDRKDGYRLTVKPVSSGSNETGPAQLAIQKKIEELTRFPFVLRLSGEGEIVELERSDEFWAAMFKVMREFLGEKALAGRTPGAAKAAESVVAMFEGMPPAVRLAKLTEPVQPLVEFAGTETTLGQPISAKVESESPFGGTLNRDVTVSLTKVANGVAYLSVRTSLPRAEFDKLMQSVVGKLGKDASAADAAKMKAGFASLKSYRQESRADYRVAVEDGMLESFQSTETIEIGNADKTTRRVTTVSLTRVN